jgi:hypothetical protein
MRRKKEPSESLRLPRAQNPREKWMSCRMLHVLRQASPLAGRLKTETRGRSGKNTGSHATCIPPPRDISSQLSRPARNAGRRSRPVSGLASLDAPPSHARVRTVAELARPHSHTVAGAAQALARKSMAGARVGTLQTPRTATIPSRTCFPFDPAAENRRGTLGSISGGAVDDGRRKRQLYQSGPARTRGHEPCRDAGKVENRIRRRDK